MHLIMGLKVGDFEFTPIILHFFLNVTRKLHFGLLVIDAKHVLFFLLMRVFALCAPESPS